MSPTTLVAPRPVAPPLSRTSSSTSVASMRSDMSSRTSTPPSSAPSSDASFGSFVLEDVESLDGQQRKYSRRTRQRYSPGQLAALDALYHTSSHPSREQRDQVAERIGISTRSVRVWFQNKRQSARRNSLPLPASQPFLSVHMEEPPTTRELTRAGSYPAYPRQRAERVPTPSLEAVATLFERPSPLPPRAPILAHPRSSPSGPKTPAGAAPLWASMLSSPPSPTPRARSVSAGLGAWRATRHARTLEWACERVETSVGLDAPGLLSDSEDEDAVITPGSELGAMAFLGNVNGGKNVGEVASVAGVDAAMMRAAEVLCGLGRAR